MQLINTAADGKVKTMPLLRRKVATLDNRFVKIEEFKGEGFDLGLSFASGLPKVTIPINQTAHMNRFWGHGWQTCSTIRLGMNNRGMWIELIFEKAPPKLHSVRAIRIAGRRNQRIAARSIQGHRRPDPNSPTEDRHSGRSQI